MNDSQGRTSTGKAVLLVVVVAITAAIASTVVQSLLLGKSNLAVTGGVVGALAAVVAVNTLRKKPS
ncbi:MAG TPA: hypothetical protein VNO50_18070 [Pyrinomonadaceae bacterium]|nr:hypothetical protein [Pyrinomonadaceae bacterium]